jgi:hypothetical protein
MARSWFGSGVGKSAKVLLSTGWSSAATTLPRDRFSCDRSLFGGPSEVRRCSGVDRSTHKRTASPLTGALQKRFPERTTLVFAREAKGTVWVGRWKRWLAPEPPARLKSQRASGDARLNRLKQRDEPITKVAFSLVSVVASPQPHRRVVEGSQPSKLWSPSRVWLDIFLHDYIFFVRGGFDVIRD